MSPRTYDQTDFVKNDRVLPKLGVPLRSEVDDIWDKLDQALDAPMMLKANFPIADSKLYISPSEIINPDGTGRSMPSIKNSVPAVPAVIIDFQDNTVSGFADVVFPTGTVGYYRRVGFTLTAGNKIQAVFSSEQAALANVTNPGGLLVGGGTALGWIDLQCTHESGKYKTANSLANIIESSVLGTPTIHRFGAGTGSGSGEGGDGVEAPAAGFEVIFKEKFAELPADPTAIARTDFTRATYDSQNAMYTFKCDKTRTVSVIGSGFTLNGIPTFPLAVGDVLWIDAASAFRKIASLSSASAGTLDSSFSQNHSGVACMISQALWTKDIVNYSQNPSQADRFSDVYGARPIDRINVYYRDSLVPGDPFFDVNVAPRLVVAASNAGSVLDTTSFPESNTFNPIFRRATPPASVEDYPLVVDPGNSERLFLCFFCDPAAPAVTTGANLIRFDTSLYLKTLMLNGGVLNSAICMSDGSSTPFNCSNPVVINGKTRVPLAWSYVPGLNINSPDGDLEVMVEGIQIPRYYPGIEGTGSYYLEVPGNPRMIEFSANLTALGTEIRIKRRQGSIDSRDENALRLSALNDGVVGDALQVDAKIANFSSLQAAIDALPEYSRIYLLGAVTENVTLSKSMSIIGKGYSARIIGNFTFNGMNGLFDGFRVIGDINFTGSDNTFARLWMSAGSTRTPGGAGNDERIIAE